MYFSTAVIAAFAATYVSASPLMVRDNTCGAAPAGSNGNNQPISLPSGIQTSAACQTQCEANSSCKSFCFGMVDNTIQCKLYSCAASAVPQQPSTNLVVYDKACSAVPSVVPTSSNPTGKKVDGQQTQSNPNSVSKATEQRAQEPKQADASNTCGTKPAASTNNQPISAPSVSSEDACKAKCQANSSCKSFTCGKVDNAMVCKLYSVAAAQVPAPSTTAQKNALKAYDVGCSI